MSASPKNLLEAQILRIRNFANGAQKSGLTNLPGDFLHTNIWEHWPKTFVKFRRPQEDSISHENDAVPSTWLGKRGCVVSLVTSEWKYETYISSDFCLGVKSERKPKLRMNVISVHQFSFNVLCLSLLLLQAASNTQTHIISEPLPTYFLHSISSYFLSINLNYTFLQETFSMFPLSFIHQTFIKCLIFFLDKLQR